MTELSCGDHIPFRWIMLVMVPDWAPAKSGEETEMLKKKLFFFFFFENWLLLCPKDPASAYPRISWRERRKAWFELAVPVSRASCMRRGRNV